MGQSLKKQSEQLVTTFRILFFRFRKTSAVSSIILQQHANRAQCTVNGAVIGRTEQCTQPEHLLVQFTRMEHQRGPSQIVGNIFGNAGLPQLNAFAKFDHYLVALFTAQQRQDGKQRFTRGMADDHPFGDLDEVGKMCADVQHVFQMFAPGLVSEHLDSDDLAHPMSGGF